MHYFKKECLFAKLSDFKYNMGYIPIYNLFYKCPIINIMLNRKFKSKGR